MWASYSDHVIAVCNVKKSIKEMDDKTKAAALDKIIEFLDNKNSSYLYDIRYMLNDLVNNK